MSVKECCTENVQIVSPNTPVAKVAQLMADNDCGSILVAEGNKLTGIITDRDIVLRCVANAKDPATFTAAECQTPKVLYCFEHDVPEKILKNMADNKVRRLAVLNNDNQKDLVGIVSFGDLTTACKDKSIPGDAHTRIRRSA